MIQSITKIALSSRDLFKRSSPHMYMNDARVHRSPMSAVDGDETENCGTKRVDRIILHGVSGQS